MTEDSVRRLEEGFLLYFFFLFPQASILQLLHQ